MNADGTCPVMHSTGAQQPSAVASAAPALSTPGPGTTANTPGRPVERAAPNAMYPHVCSWRAPKVRILSERCASASNSE